jgi:hypothetical protein
MKTRSGKTLELLFPHLDDPAYQKLGDLEELVATFVATRSTAPFKQRLQRAIARLSEALVEYVDADGDPGREVLLFSGLRDCRKAANAIQMLYRAGVLPAKFRAAAFELLADIAQLLIERIRALVGLPSPGTLPRPVFEDVERNDTPPRSQSPPAAA